MEKPLVKTLRLTCRPKHNKSSDLRKIILRLKIHSDEKKGV